MSQQAAWERVLAGGEQAVTVANANAGTTGSGNPWGMMYRDEAVARMERGAARQMQPVVMEAERVRAEAQ
jgi:hypothetical protein